MSVVLQSEGKNGFSVHWNNPSHACEQSAEATANSPLQAGLN